MINPQDDPVSTVFERHYIRAQYMWVQMMTEHLADCSRAFRGDLQAMLVLALIGQSFLFRLIQDGHGDRDENSALPVLYGTAINASSLSEILGIPRETVRRKLKFLSEQGWIEKDSSGWRLSLAGEKSHAHRDLEALDARSTARIAKLIASFNRLARG